MMGSRIIKVGFDVNDQTFFSENMLCKNGLCTAEFRYALGEYGDSTLYYTVLFPLAERGEIAVIAHGGSWSIIGKASLPQEKWSSWVENLIQKDINRVCSDDSYYTTRSLPDNQDDFDSSGELHEEAPKMDWNPKGITSFKNGYLCNMTKAVRAWAVVM